MSLHIQSTHTPSYPPCSNGSAHVPAGSLCSESVSGISCKQTASPQCHGSAPRAFSNQTVLQIVTRKMNTCAPSNGAWQSLRDVPSNVVEDATFWQRKGADIARTETPGNAISGAFQRATFHETPDRIQRARSDTLSFFAQTALDEMQINDVGAASGMQISRDSACKSKLEIHPKKNGKIE